MSKSNSREKTLGMSPISEVNTLPFILFRYCQSCTNTVEPRLSVPRLSGFPDYPDFFPSPNFIMNNFLVTIKIRKTTVLKSVVKSEFMPANDPRTGNVASQIKHKNVCIRNLDSEFKIYTIFISSIFLLL